ncbi:MAG: UDP-glucose/GDP-mannose dehydrogenase family protein [Candidatus Lokiarchaeota archaeon]|nr:UDP-glucose/GDP-mannose dehydrogenase family protein [Candidatus Lokiarchaeota archaeon]
MEINNLGIIGTGMVGGAMQNYFLNKKSITLYTYDKGKNEGNIGDIDEYADVVFICVPTPWDEETKHFDTNIVEEVISNFIDNKVFVIKSTVSLGTTRELQKKYPQHKILFNPEFLTEVTADQDMQFPDRQIIGYASDEGFRICGDIMNILPLAPFEKIVPVEQAEAVKLFGNSWFAVKVALMNQFYDTYNKLTEGERGSFQEVADMMAQDKRIGRTHLRIMHKGYRGYGGKCLPKDTRCVIEQSEGLASILEVAEKYNNALIKQQELEGDR